MAAADDLYDLPPGVDLPLAAATPRCWPSIDEVATDGARRGAVIVCLDWANGRCAAGIGCAARHALPSIADENRMAHSADGLLCDIFGRPRAPASETPLSVFDPLACSTIHIVSGMPPGDQHERRRALDESLSEWGQVVKSWFLADTRSCFVKFKWRSTAQLVLEALQGRPLRPEDNEPLELAWATVDPSIVQARQGRELAYSAMREARERGRATQALYDRLEREHMADDDDSDGDLFADEDPHSAATLFGVLQQLDEAPPSAPIAETIDALLASHPAAVSLGERGLGDDGVGLLASAVAAAATAIDHVTSLSLRRNDVGDARSVAAVCMALPRLESLDLSGNRIIGDGLSSVAASLPASLTMCDLSSNAFGDAGVAALGAALAGGAVPRLRSLYLDRVDGGNDGVVALARGVAARHGLLAQLSELWLSNNQIGDAGAAALFAALGAGALPSLGDLRLQFNTLGDASAATLADALTRGALSCCWYLGLSDNAFTDAGLEALVSAVRAGALPRLEFCTATGRATSDAAHQVLQDALTARRRK